MLEQQIWQAFKATKEENFDAEYTAWAFGAVPDELASLVLAGEKTATASSFIFYELEDEVLPKEGDYNIILDSKEEAVCITETTKVYLAKFSEITEAHAYKEGEGDKSLKYWREVHEAFFTKELAEIGKNFDTDMIVVCEEFECVYPKSK